LPSSRVSATNPSLSSTDHRRRRSTRVISSIRSAPSPYAYLKESGIRSSLQTAKPNGHVGHRPRLPFILLQTSRPRTL
jgi:hypothetical protein